MSERTVLYRASTFIGEVEYQELEIVRATPAGWWVRSEIPRDDGRPWPKWTSGKFASPTKEGALGRLKARARSYAKHQARRYNAAVAQLRLLELPIPLKARVDSVVCVCCGETMRVPTRCDECKKLVATAINQWERDNPESSDG